MSIINEALKKVQESREKKSRKKDAENAVQHKAPEAPVQAHSEPASQEFQPKKSLFEPQPQPSPAAPVSAASPSSPEENPIRDFMLEHKKIREITLIVMCTVVSVSLLWAIWQLVSFRMWATTEKENFQLKGIVMMDERNIVLINDRAFETGDMINGMRIVDISLDEVKFQKWGKTKTLRVKQ